MRSETDFALEEDALDRELQSRELARIMEQSYPDPVIFLGYVVSKPHAPYRKAYNDRLSKTLILKI